MDDKQILDDTIMLLDTQLSAVNFRMAGILIDDPEFDVLNLLKYRLTQDLYWYSSIKHGISEGYI